jgi:hypothetical protein
MQANQSALKEILQTHPAPAVVIRISNHKARQYKKEIHRQITVVDDLFLIISSAKGFEQVKNNHHNGCYTTQSI